MEELLNKATEGVDLGAPDAFWHIFWNLMALVPWAELFWWSLLFLVVGGLLGWWRGRFWEGLVWSAVLGPFGWVVILLRPRAKPPAGPPPLPR